MKKTILYTLLTFSLISTTQSCFAQKVVVNREVETQTGDKMLLGAQTLDQFSKEPYASWFDEGKNSYKLEESTISELKKQKLASYNLVVFVGTWCGDSHREFPRLIKILENTNYNTKKMQIIGVNRKKESPNGEEGLYNVHFVPTIIVKKYGKEIGRITEMPSTGYLERDLLNILKKDDNKSILKNE